MSESKIIPIYEFHIYKLHSLLRRQIVDKTIDKICLREALYKTLRALMWFYKDVDVQSPIVGCQFELIPSDINSNISLRSSLVTNSGSEIEFNNEKLKKCIVDMYSKKLLSDKKIFFHWKIIEEFEKDERKKASKKKRKV